MLFVFGKLKEARALNITYNSIGILVNVNISRKKGCTRALRNEKLTLKKQPLRICMYISVSGKEERNRIIFSREKAKNIIKQKRTHTRTLVPFVK